MVPIIGTFEAQEQRTVLGLSQPTHSITEECVYNARSPGGMKRVEGTKSCGLCGAKATSQKQPTLNVAARQSPRCFTALPADPLACSFSEARAPRRHRHSTKPSAIFCVFRLKAGISENLTR